MDNRIGINPVDIVIEADDLYGDGVNIAARIGLPSCNGAAPRSCSLPLQSYAAIYADHFESYAGQKLEVTGEQPAVSGVTVHSQVVKANGEPVKVNLGPKSTCVLRLETVTR